MSKPIRSLLVLIVAILIASNFQAQADVLAYWDFEDGTVGAAPDSAAFTTDTVATVDASGNGNDLYLSAATTSFTTNVLTGSPTSSTLSLQNTANTDLRTQSRYSAPTLDLETVALDEFFIEAFINETSMGDNKTFVGRDGSGGASQLYLKTSGASGSGYPKVEYQCESGTWYTLAAASQGMVTNHWYYVAVRMDGEKVQLWYADPSVDDHARVVAEADANSNPRLLADTTATPSGYPGYPSTIWNWSVGRGFYNNGPTDYFLGYLDDVRIQDATVGDTLFPRCNVEMRIDLPLGTQTTGYEFTMTRTVTLKNIGDTALTLNSLTPDKGSYTTDTLTLDTTGITLPGEVLNAGESVQFTVTWTPEAGRTGARDFSIIPDTSDSYDDAFESLGASVSDALQTSLVVYYDFNETTGVTLEDKAPEGTRNDASVIGDTLTSRTVTGLIGQAYSKPANLTSYVTADTTADNIDQLYTHPDIQFGDNATGTDFTINSWIKVYGPSSGGKRTMGSVNFNESSSALRNGVSILSDGNTSFRWRLHTTSSSSLDTSERTTMSSTNYRMMSYVMTRGNGANGAGQVKIYVDGVLASTNNPAAAMTGAITGNDGHMAWRFGQDLATYTQADFDEFGVWKRALSASELQQIYSMGNAGQCLLDIVPSPTITISDDRDAEYYTDNVSTPTYTVIVTVTNNGVLPLTIEPQSFTGSDSGEFAFAGSYDETTSKTILPGYSLDIPIVWTWATPEETKDAFLSFDHNDALNGSHSDYALDLVLTHIEPSLTVTDNAETLYYRDDATTFGITVTVTNDSPGQLNIGARSLSSPDAAQFAFANDESSPVTLNSADPDETYDIDVVWTWDGTADYTTSFTVTFDNNVEPDYATTYTVTVELGTRPAVISVTDDAESIYYADQPGPYYFNVIVSNPSLGTLVIEPQSFGGADAAQFDFASSWDESTSRSIAPSGSLNIPVVWTPESVGVVTSATLSFDHNDATNGSHTDYGLELVQQSRDSQYLTLQNDLVIYYHFNETSGNVISDYALTDGAQDASVIGRAMDLATTTGIVYQDKYSVNGAFHDTTGTLNFAAIDNVADDSYTTTGFVSQLQFGDQASGTDFSISTWIKPVNLFDGNLRLMGDIDFTISYSVAGRAGIAILCDGDNGVGNAYSSSRFRIQNLANTTRYDLYGGVFDDFANVTYGETPEWRMLTLTMDRSGGENGTGLATVYCDGLVVNETSVAADFTGSMDGNIAWMFGRDINTGDAIVAFDEFAVWHRAIADSEVKYIYSAGIRGYEFTDPASYVPPKPDPSATQRNLWEVLQ